MTAIRTINTGAVTDFASGVTSRGNVITTEAVLNTADTATGLGITDDTAAINSWIAGTGIKVLLNGDYLVSGAATAFGRPTLILADNAKESGTELPFISITPPSINFKNIPQTHMFIRQNTDDRLDPFTVRIERIVNGDVGYGVPQALRVWTQKNHSNSNTEFVISGILDNYSDTASSGDACSSGVSNKYGTAAAFAGHFQMNDMIKRTAATSVTASPAVEMNIQAIGLDHPTANSNLGYRRVLDVIAKTNYNVSGWNTATDNYGEAEIGQGIVIRNDDGGSSGRNGYFRYGLAIVDMPSNTNPISTAMYINTNGGKGIELAGNVSGSQIVVQGSSSYGLVLNGTYSQVAMRINTGQAFGWNTTNTIKQSYNTVANVLGFFDTTTLRFGVNMSDGTVQFGTWTTNADAAVNGYITVKDAAGNTRKLATIA